MHVLGLEGLGGTRGQGRHSTCIRKRPCVSVRSRPIIAPAARSVSCVDMPTSALFHNGIGDAPMVCVYAYTHPRPSSVLPVLTRPASVPQMLGDPHHEIHSDALHRIIARAYDALHRTCITMDTATKLLSELGLERGEGQPPHPSPKSLGHRARELSTTRWVNVSRNGDDPPRRVAV